MGSIRELPRLLVRADADTERGSGHVMRCLALAQAWQGEGGRALFLSRCHSEVLRQRIEASGAGFLLLTAEESSAGDLDATLSVVREGQASFVVLDGYDFDLDYQLALRAAGCRLMVIDDTVRLPRYETDFLLNQNLGADRLGYICGHSTRLMLGPKYALLRREFTAWRSRMHIVPETGCKILVTLGGSDPDNVTLKVIHALRQLRNPRLQIRVVAGHANPHIDELRDVAAEFPGRLELLAAVPDMAALMAWADLAVSGAGSTCWELACLGLPAVTLVLAENQQIIADELAAAGAVLNLGWHAKVSIDRLATAVDALLFSSFRRLCMSRTGRALVDGKGAHRVAATLSQHDCVGAA